MDFGIALPNFGRLGHRDGLVAVARRAEALGYQAIWATDHVMLPKGFEEPYGHILEAVVTLSYLAPLTERVYLGTSAIVLPQRQPVLVAKQIASLDALSGGRVIVGMSAGWNEPQFRFLGARFQDRGRRFDEYIRVLRELWTSNDPHFEGSYVTFGDALFSPRPAGAKGPPIWVGGHSPAALRRAAELGDGWQATGLAPDEFGGLMQEVRRMAAGRTVGGSVRLRAAVGQTLPVQRTASGVPETSLSGSPNEIVTIIDAYRDAGADSLILQFVQDDLQRYLDQMERFAADVRPKIAQVS